MCEVTWLGRDFGLEVCKTPVLAMSGGCAGVFVYWLDCRSRQRFMEAWAMHNGAGSGEVNLPRRVG
jgi:hypothetical protein